MTMKESICTDPANHANHICALKHAGHEDKIREACQDPRIYCLYCAARVREQASVCQPELIS